VERKIRIAGAAGQGVKTAADLLGKAVNRSGFFATCYMDAESRIRGGLNFSHLRVATQPCQGITDDYDILVALSDPALEEFVNQLPKTGTVIGHRAFEHPLAAPLILSKLAEQAGNNKAAGSVAFAAVCALLGIRRQIAEKVVEEHFHNRTDLAKINAEAVKLGYDAALSWKPGERFRMPDQQASAKHLWMAGNQAMSLGAVAGGVHFVAGYPMSPATSILANLANWAKQADILVEQAEDEIAAINMVAGASYAGARSMTATSGGGFCLMTEGISLLGMIEGPAVIIIGQRPGPSTGLPTRTAQGDLHLVLHAGQGFFPRVILAPKNISDCFEITARAFDIAERYQVPVFVMTDQLLQDSQTSIEHFDSSDLPSKRYFLSSQQLDSMKSYQRFAQTESGISPLAAPGISRHVVVVDSDEHDEDGHLTESAATADRMARKRLRKAKTLQETALLRPADVEGEVEGRALLISWGSTYETVAEARSVLTKGGSQLAHLNLRQLWPLDEKLLSDLMKSASRVIVVENNVSGELANLLRRTALQPVDQVITRMDGRPFNVAELVSRLGEVL
jgi:2-oxoglutarate/2-oxoacid ferredoxin oxidoreductase subunit alpha